MTTDTAGPLTLDTTLVVVTDPGTSTDELAWPPRLDGFDVLAVEPGTELAAALDQVTTGLVMFSHTGHSGGPDAGRTVAHAAALAERLGLADLGLPLPALSWWKDVEVLAAYRSWLASRHPEVLARRGEQIDTYLNLVRFRAVSSSLHGFDVVGGGTVLRVVGRSRRGGTNGDQPPADHAPVVLLLDDEGTVRHRTPVVQTQLAEAGDALWWVGFTADIPIASLPAGRFRLAVELEGVPQDTPLRGRMYATVGILSGSRTVRTAGKRLQIVQTGGSAYTLDLVVADDRSWVDGLRWAVGLAWLDVKAFLRRRQFGGLRMLRLVTRPFFLGRPIWLVGERTDTARDNGHHLFAYLRRERRDVRAFYVITKDSDQYERMAALGKVVPHSSVRHRLLFLHATALVDAYSIKYLVPRQWDPAAYARQLAWRLGAYRVYLKHGINDKLALKRRVSGYDLYFTGVEGETIAAKEGSGYDQQIVQAGLARYDALTPTPPSRTILFMPTWRSYLTPKLFSDEETSERDFEGSDYQRFMLDFLASERLRDLLEKHDFRLQFMPHYNLADRLSDAPTSSDRIDRLGSADANIQDIMRGCDLFVTDYSSVHFDLAYVGTPLVYTHFDLEDFRSGHANASWFVHERDGFGPVAYDLESTLDLIERYLDNGCEREQVYTDRARAAFVHQDTDNCRRTVEAIEQLIQTRGIR